VLIAGCDTFRAGAIEQLKTHVNHLNNIFNEKNMPMIELYQRGYGKDAAGIAAEAINYGWKIILKYIFIAFYFSSEG
jgi:signal recognition particle receptor subunit alpha